MSFLNLSDNSKARVMQCLGYNRPALARLRKTGYKINNCAVNNNLDKIEAHSVYFSCTSQRHSMVIDPGAARNAEPITCKFQVIIHPKKAKEANGKNDRELPNYLSYYENTPRKGDRAFKSPDIKGDANRLMKAAVKLLKEAFNSIKSVEQLSIQCESGGGGFVINSTFLTNLKIQKDKIKNVSCLTLAAPLDLNASELSQLFSLMKVEHASFHGRVTPLAITDELIAPLKSLTFESRDYHNRAPQIIALTDETLEKWKANPPATVKIVAANTSFSFAAIWDFIQDAVKKRKENKMSPAEYYFGTLRRVEEFAVTAGELTQAQKKRNYFWNPEGERMAFREENNTKKYTVTYKKDSPDERCIFRFDIPY